MLRENLNPETLDYNWDATIAAKVGRSFPPINRTSLSTSSRKIFGFSRSDLSFCMRHQLTHSLSDQGATKTPSIFPLFLIAPGFMSRKVVECVDEV
jgi:hypothetical protein